MLEKKWTFCSDDCRISFLLESCWKKYLWSSWNKMVFNCRVVGQIIYRSFIDREFTLTSCVCHSDTRFSKTHMSVEEEIGKKCTSLTLEVLWMVLQKCTLQMCMVILCAVLSGVLVLVSVSVIFFYTQVFRLLNRVSQTLLIRLMILSGVILPFITFH